MNVAGGVNELRALAYGPPPPPLTDFAVRNALTELATKVTFLAAQLDNRTAGDILIEHMQELIAGLNP